MYIHGIFIFESIYTIFAKMVQRPTEQPLLCIMQQKCQSDNVERSLSFAVYSKTAAFSESHCIFSPEVSQVNMFGTEYEYFIRTHTYM